MNKVVYLTESSMPVLMVGNGINDLMKIGSSAFRSISQNKGISYQNAIYTLEIM